MERWLGRFSPQLYAILRIIAGAMFFLHGTQKLFDWPPPSNMPHPLPAIVLAAGIIELVGGALITIGLFGSLAAFISSGEMAFAYFLGHAKDGFFPVVNHGEPAVLYCFVFLYIAAVGSGVWSLDALRRKR